VNEDEFIKNFPTVMKYIGSGAGYLAAGVLFLRQWLSQAKVDRTANDSNAATINRLQAQVIVERDRADSLMREREAMVRELGELKGKVEVLSEQVETLTNLVKQLKGAA
jgi:hypothetical protein